MSFAGDMKKYSYFIKQTIYNLFFLTCIFMLNSCNSTYKPQIYDFNPVSKDALHKKPKIALVLGGGGAKGVAHLGVLEVLEEAGVEIDLIVGTSAGSIIGALYADNPDSLALKNIIMHATKKDIANISLSAVFNGVNSLKGVFDGKVGEEFLKKHMKAKDFSELLIPFIAIATDIKTGDTVALCSGPVATAVRASYSLPGLFSPVEIGEMMLVDGGVTAPVAPRIARKEGAEFVIVVNIATPIKKLDITNMITVVKRASHITFNSFVQELLKDADVVIEPDVGDVGMFDDMRNEEMYQSGRRAALAKLPEILAITKNVMHLEFVK